MVQGIEVVKIDVIFFTYNPMVDINNPMIKEDSICLAGSYELKSHRDYKRKQKNEMGSDAYNHYKWYSLVLKTELNTADYNSKLKIIHWHIESSDTEAYTLDGKFYKAVSLIYGPEKVYWYYANTGRNATYRYGCRFHKIPANTKKLSRIAMATTEPKQKVHISKCACYIERKFSKIIEESETELLKEQCDDVIVYSYPIVANRNQKQLVGNGNDKPCRLGSIHEEE